MGDLRAPLRPQGVEKPAQRLGVVPGQPTPAGPCRGRRRPSGTGGHGDSEISSIPIRTSPSNGSRLVGRRPRPARRSPRRCARRPASTRPPPTSSNASPARRPGHRTPGCARPVTGPRHRRHRHPVVGAVDRGASASMNTRTVPASNARHRRRPTTGHTRAPCSRSGHTAAKHHCAAAPAPPPASRPRRLPPRTPRPRCPRSPCAGRHPAAHTITSHCARRCPLLWFLTFDKPETLSDNDVRPLISTMRPRKCQKSQKLLRFHQMNHGYGVAASVASWLW